MLADPPTGEGVDSWLDAKTRVIKVLRPLTPADTVRGQYDGYREVSDVDPHVTVTATEVSIGFHRPPDTTRFADSPLTDEEELP